MPSPDRAWHGQRPLQQQKSHSRVSREGRALVGAAPVLLACAGGEPHLDPAVDGVRVAARPAAETVPPACAPQRRIGSVAGGRPGSASSSKGAGDQQGGVRLGGLLGVVSVECRPLGVGEKGFEVGRGSAEHLSRNRSTELVVPTPRAAAGREPYVWSQLHREELLLVAPVLVQVRAL